MALVVEEAEPLALVAVNWKLYVVFAAKPVMVAVVAFVPGAGVQIVQVGAPDTRYCNV